MAKLKLGAIADDKPIKLTVELPAAVHRDLIAYAEALARETGQADRSNPPSWSRRCWRGSSPATAHSPNCAESGSPVHRLRRRPSSMPTSEQG